MREFKTADLCDDNQNKNIQVLSNKFINYGGKKVFKARIKTIKLDRSNWGLIEILKNRSGRGKALVVDVNEDYYAVVGDRLSLLAERNEYEALIINGYVRDIIETKKFNIALFALGTCPKRFFEKTSCAIELTLSFANTVFKEDDYVYCDEDGLIVSNEKLI